MYGIFIQEINGLTWVGNEDTIERAKVVAEDYRGHSDIDFVLVLKVEHLIDNDGERV